MLRSDMIARLDEGESPLELAIEKWYDIKAGRHNNIGPSTCALCYVYWRHDCVGCPIYEETGCDGCEHTPYEPFFDHHENCKEENCARCSELAQDEIEFLESLRRD